MYIPKSAMFAVIPADTLQGKIKVLKARSDAIKVLIARSNGKRWIQVHPDAHELR